METIIGLYCFFGSVFVCWWKYTDKHLDKKHNG